MTAKLVPYKTPEQAIHDDERLAFLRRVARFFGYIDGCEYSIDHILPTARGGWHTDGNWQVIPRLENRVKAHLDNQPRCSLQCPVEFKASTLCTNSSQRH